MPDLRVIDFKPEHFGQFILRGYDRSPIEVFPDLKIRAEQLNGSPAYTGLVNGEIIGCAGVQIQWPGVGEAWMMVSTLIEKYPLFVHRSVKKALIEIQEQYQLQRIQTTVLADFETAHKWVERLGFQCEGIMRKFGPDGSDHYRYALLKN